MAASKDDSNGGTHTAFDRAFLDSVNDFSLIGGGELGGKGAGLAAMRQFLETGFNHSVGPGIEVRVPRLAVITTDHFERFARRNRLDWRDFAGLSDERVAQRLLRCELPEELVGDLWALASQIRTPLAVRSSSRLEDALAHPFAGIYETKMTPNNQPDARKRFEKLVEAVKFVYASTWFQAGMDYRQALGVSHDDEAMAVIIQEVVGSRKGDRYYPTLSGVARSFNYYPFGHARPEEGTATLALGLGKTIVDGQGGWVYGLAWPRTVMPCGSNSELLDRTQKRFWAVGMGAITDWDPTRETEYLVTGELDDARYDGELELLVSSYDGESDRLRPGRVEEWPQLITFAPLLDLELLPLNAVVQELVRSCKEHFSSEVELEFAATIAPDRRSARFGLLQVRPTAGAREQIEVTPEELAGQGTLLRSHQALGNGRWEGIGHVVYLRPDRFNIAQSRRIAAEVARADLLLREVAGGYLLVGFGRWGSTDPWLGVPVSWGQVSRARVIAEVGFHSLFVEPSQGSHFFHNISSFGVSYLCLPESEVQWAELAGWPTLWEGDYARVAITPRPLTVKVDGRSGRGVVLL